MAHLELLLTFLHIRPGWLRIVEEGIIRVEVVLNCELLFLARQGWEVVSLTMVEAFRPLLAKAGNLVKVRRHVKEHHDAKEANWVEEKSEEATCLPETHVFWQVYFFIAVLLINSLESGNEVRLTSIA